MVPIVAMGICYGRIGSVLWGRKNQLLRENACNDLARQRKLHSKRKVKYITCRAYAVVSSFIANPGGFFPECVTLRVT